MDGWNQADDETKASYGSAARDEMIAFTRYISSDPFFVNERTENVSDAVADALLSPEPNLFYECLQWKHWLARKLLFDCMPWDIAVYISNYLQERTARQAPVFRP